MPMTPKTTIGVDFRELTSIELKCTNCGAGITIPIRAEYNAASLSCPGCNTHWWGEGRSGLFMNVRDLCQSISNWQRRDDGPFTIGFTLPIERL